MLSSKRPSGLLDEIVNPLDMRGMKPPEQEIDAYPEAETEARREAALKRMLATPHKPHKAAKRGQGKLALPGN